MTMRYVTRRGQPQPKRAPVPEGTPPALGKPMPDAMPGAATGAAPNYGGGGGGLGIGGVQDPAAPQPAQYGNLSQVPQGNVPNPQSPQQNTGGRLQLPQPQYQQNPAWGSAAPGGSAAPNPTPAGRQPGAGFSLGDYIGQYKQKGGGVPQPPGRQPIGGGLGDYMANAQRSGEPARRAAGPGIGVGDFGAPIRAQQQDLSALANIGGKTREDYTGGGAQGGL